MSSEVFGHSIYRGTPPSSVREERDTEREREREREGESPCVGAPFGAGGFGLCSVSNLRITIHA